MAMNSFELISLITAAGKKKAISTRSIPNRVQFLKNTAEYIPRELPAGVDDYFGRNVFDAMDEIDIKIMLLV